MKLVLRESDEHTFEVEIDGRAHPCVVVSDVHTFDRIRRTVELSLGAAQAAVPQPPPQPVQEELPQGDDES